MAESSWSSASKAQRTQPQRGFGLSEAATGGGGYLHRPPLLAADEQDVGVQQVHRE